MRRSKNSNLSIKAGTSKLEMIMSKQIYDLKMSKIFR